MLCFLNCVTEFIQVAVGSKYLPGGPHFGQLWFTISLISLVSHTSEICVVAVLLQSVGNYIRRRGRRRERRYASLPSFIDIHEAVERHLWNARHKGAV
jgi:hypothetical protein